MQAVPDLLVREVSSDDVRDAMYNAKQTLKRELQRSGVDPYTHLLDQEWPYTASQEVRDEFVAWFKRTVIHGPSAGNASLMFAKAVLAVIGDDEFLTETQQTLVEALCLAMKERPLSSGLWVDFFRERLSTPRAISFVLTGCVRHNSRLEKKIQQIIEKDYAKLSLSEDRTILVFGYSATIISALQGLPLELVKTLTLITPIQYLPDREIPDGVLLAQEIHDRHLPFAKVQIVDQRKALECLQTKGISLFLMGCKVIGHHKDGRLEIVNSTNADFYAQEAYRASVPTAVVTGTYKLWPTQTYEKYYNDITENINTIDARSSLIEGRLITWVITEDGIMPQETFEREYKNYFSAHGIPVASIRECLSRGESEQELKSLAWQIEEIEKKLAVFGALSNSNTGFRTASGIAEAIGLPTAEVDEILKEAGDTVQQVDAKDSEGRELFTLRRRRLKARGNPSRSQTFLTKPTR